MKYYVVRDPIESSIINAKSLREALKSNRVYGFKTLEDAKHYAKSQQLKSKKQAQFPVYEVEYTGKILWDEENLKDEKITYSVPVLERASTTLKLIKAFCGDKDIFFLDEYEIDKEQDKDLVPKYKENKGQIEEIESWQELNAKKQAYRKRLQNEIRDLENSLIQKEVTKHQVEISDSLKEARKRVIDAQIIEKAKKEKATKLSFYLKIAAVIGVFALTSFLVSYTGGAFIILDLIQKMGFTLALSKLNLIGVSVISGILIPLTVSVLYYLGVGLKVLWENDYRTDQEKHKETYHKLITNLKNVINCHFENDAKDKIFIEKLQEIELSLNGTQFEKNGRRSPIEKQPPINRDQFLLFEFDALEELIPLSGKVRKDKEEEILADARRRFNTKPNY